MENLDFEGMSDIKCGENSRYIEPKFLSTKNLDNHDNLKYSETSSLRYLNSSLADIPQYSNMMEEET